MADFQNFPFECMIHLYLLFYVSKQRRFRLIDHTIIIVLININEGLDGGGGSGIHYSLKI